MNTSPAPFSVQRETLSKCREQDNSPTPAMLTCPQRMHAWKLGCETTHLWGSQQGSSQASSWKGARLVHGGHHAHGLHFLVTEAFPPADIGPVGNSKFNLQVQATSYTCRRIYWYSSLADTSYKSTCSYLRKPSWEQFKWMDFVSKTGCEQNRGVDSSVSTAHSVLRQCWLNEWGTCSLRVSVTCSMQIICMVSVVRLCMPNLHAFWWVLSFFLALGTLHLH